MMMLVLVMEYEDASCGSMFLPADRRVLGWELVKVDGPNCLKISRVHASQYFFSTDLMHVIIALLYSLSNRFLGFSNLPLSNIILLFHHSLQKVILALTFTTSFCGYVARATGGKMHSQLGFGRVTWHPSFFINITSCSKNSYNNSIIFLLFLGSSSWILYIMLLTLSLLLCTRMLSVHNTTT